MIARHEVLRTGVPGRLAGQPFQQVLRSDELGWELPVSRRGRRRTWPARWRGGGGTPFDLAAEIPVRARLLPAGPGRARAGAGDAPHRHRRLVDGVAGAGPVGARTRRGRAGRAPGWAPLPVQYADYALWQRELLGAETTRAACWPGSWRTGGRRWPGCRRSWRCPPTGPARRCRQLPRRAACRLRGPGRGARSGWRSWPGDGVTLFMVLQAALAVLLSRLGAGEDIPVGHADRGADRRGAGRPGRVLRQHAGAAHRPVRRPVVRASCWAGCGRRPGRLRAPGRAVRAAGGGAGPGPVAGPPPAVPGDADAAERRAAAGCWTCPALRAGPLPGGDRAGAKFDLDVAVGRGASTPTARPAGLRGR